MKSPAYYEGKAAERRAIVAKIKRTIGVLGFNCSTERLRSELHELTAWILKRDSRHNKRT